MFLFPPLWVKLMGVGIILLLIAAAYAGYRLYSHGVEVAETRNAAASAIRARQIVEKQGENLVALRADEARAREDREAFKQERDKLQERIRVAREMAKETEKKHLEIIDDQQDRIDNLGEKQREEMGTCDIDDIIILPRLSVNTNLKHTHLLFC